MRDDMMVFRLPDESLSSFEGSGFETYFELELPLRSNSIENIKQISDVKITFDVRASYSPLLHDADISAPQPTTVSRLSLFLARFAASPCPPAP